MNRLIPIAGLLFLLACAQPIAREELLARLRSDSRLVVVDVRTRSEYDAAHVPGAIHIPFYSVLGGAEALIEDGAEQIPIVVYCEHGPRAGLARAQLWLLTKREIRFLDGHMSRWKQEGLPVEPSR